MSDEMTGAGPLLEVADLVVEFRGKGLGAKRFRAVDGVGLTVAPGEVVGIVGESGSGKTTLGKAIVRLYRPAAGRILFEGEDIARLGETSLRPIRRKLQMVFQDPLSSFNPRVKLREALTLPLRLHRLCAPNEMLGRIEAMLARVGLQRQHLDLYPHELSGGQLQRAAICRALLLSPSLVVADEAVSKLDVSVRAQILNLLRDIQRSMGLSLIFITHDLHVARYLCDRIAVMYFGKIVEFGPTEQIVRSPQHDYTKALFGARDEAIAPVDPLTTLVDG
jgi:ABC-type oligopeptide transport system ATPase subunit